MKFYAGWGQRARVLRAMLGPQAGVSQCDCLLGWGAMAAPASDRVLSASIFS